MAIQEIYISSKGKAVQAKIYRLEGITEKEAEKLRTELLTNPVTEQSSLNEFSTDGQNAVEIGYKPGVMDPIEATVIKAANELGITPQAVSTSTLYLTLKTPFVGQVERIIHQKPDTLLIDAPTPGVEYISIQDHSNKELEELSKERSLFLNLDEMKAIQSFAQDVGRELTDVEIEIFAQTWSEHNGHKTFKAVLIGEEGNRYPPLMSMIKDASENHFDNVEVVSAFADNAGGLRFYDGQVILIKGETHNKPKQVFPYGGDLTKIGGVLRDIGGFGKGGKNLAAFIMDCFADPETPDHDIPRGVLPPKHLLLEGSRGERDYGNRMGVPTVSLNLQFHKDFIATCTSLGIVIGIIPEIYAHKEEPQLGDLLITVGGKTGRDGIHGATFSSGVTTSETSTVHSTAVQIGNPIEQKRMFDALEKCRDSNLIRSITDCGGGGYSSAIGEMAEPVGVEVNLDLVPLKYQGLSPWEIWLSESQERMIVAISPDNWEEFKKICIRFDTPTDVIGIFTGDKTLTLKHNDKIVAHLPMEFLHNGLPKREMEIKRPERLEINDVPNLPENLVSVYKDVLSNLNVVSAEPMLRQYDQTVQGRSALSPFTGVYEDCPSDASVIAPIYGKPYGVVTAHATNPILNRINPYWGSVWAGAEAFSKFASVGGDISKAVINDNFISPFPDPETLWDLRESTKALCDIMKTVKVPCVSGKDSLSSTFKGSDGTVIKIPPVLNVTVMGKIPDVEKTVSSDFKKTGSTLVLVGQQDINNMGGSIYFQNVNCLNSHLPEVDLEVLPEVLGSMQGAITSGQVLSSKAIGEGGLATSLAQMCFGGDCGADIDVSVFDAKRPDYAFFNETAGTFIVEVESIEVAQKLFGKVPHKIMGKTTADKTVRIRDLKKELIAVDLYELKETWQRPMKEILNAS